MHKIAFFVPASHLEAVKTALFAAGAGRLGDYDCCAWQTLGEGQFRPLSGAQPFIGQTGEIQQLAEYKVELVCTDDCLKAAVQALKSAHPYEEPAYDVWPLLSI